MFNVNDIKNGMTIKYEGVIYQVVEFQHVKPGKGSAFVKTKLKNLRAGTTQEITFNAGIKMEKADVRKNQLSYLYAAGDNYVFMDNNTYDQIELPSNLLKDEAKFLKEGMSVESMNIEGEVIGITLPEKVSYKVIFFVHTEDFPFRINRRIWIILSIMIECMIYKHNPFCQCESLEPKTIILI